MPKTRTSASHPGQAHASPRKRERRRIKREELDTEAAALGISIGELVQRKFAEVTNIATAQSLRLAAATVTEQAARELYGYGSGEYWRALRSI